MRWRKDKEMGVIVHFLSLCVSFLLSFANIMEKSFEIGYDKEKE
jgi:hypothetical protein